MRGCRCVSAEEPMGTSSDFDPAYMENSSEIPEGKDDKGVPKPLFLVWKLSHVFVLFLDIFPKPLFLFRFPVLILVVVCNISPFFLTIFSHHR